MSRPAFLELASRVIFHAVIVGSVYLLFAGHNQPGGGFVGGLVAGAAIALRYLTGGIVEVRAISRFQPWTILGGGITLAVATAIAPMLTGRAVMTSMSASLHPPLLGHIAASTTLVFDAGVYLAVVGLVFMVFEAFADEHATAADLADLADLAGRDARDDGAPS